MKFLAVVAAGILAASAITPVPASAAPAPARWGHGHGAKWRTVCTVRWNHHRKVRVCRKVRVGR